MFKRRGVIVSKIEGTAGTAESLTPATDGAMNHYNVKWTPPKAKSKREQQASWNNLASIAEDKKCSISFECDAVGNGGAGLPLWASTYLPACAFVNSAGTFTRSSVPSDHKTVTIGYYVDGKLHTIAGAMGTFTIEIANGKLGRFKFTFTGKYMGATAAAMPTTITFPTTKPPRGLASFTIGSYVPLTDKLVFDAGNTVHMIETLVADANSTGYLYAEIPMAEAKLTASPNEDLIANQDWDALWAASTESAMSAVIGNAANNTITVAAAAGAEVEDAGDYGDRDGIVTRDVTMALNQGFTIALS